MMDSAATLAVENKLKEYNERSRDLFQKSVRNAKKYNTEEIIGLMSPLSKLGNGILVLQPVASSQHQIGFSGVSFPSDPIISRIAHNNDDDDDDFSQSKRVRLIQWHNGDHTGFRMCAPSLLPQDKATILEECGSLSFPKIGIPRHTDYKIIAGHVDVLPSFLTTLFNRIGEGTDSYDEIIISSAGDRLPLSLPMLVDGTCRTSIQCSHRDWSFNIDHNMQVVREKIRHRFETYKAELKHFISEMRNRRRPPEYDNEDEATHNRRTDMLRFAEWCDQSEDNYIVHYKYRGIWQPRDPPQYAYTQYQGLTAKLRHMVTYKKFSGITTDSNQIDSPSVIPVPRDGDEDSQSVPVLYQTPYYRFGIQKVENEVRFRLNYVKNITPSLFGNEITDDDTDRRGFDSDMKRFEFDLNIRECTGYQDEYRLFVNVLLQTIFAKTPRPEHTRLPTIGMVNMNAGKRDDGFVYIPATTKTIEEDVLYKDKMYIHVMATDPYEFLRSYPTWTLDKKDSVASAALFVWRHAMSRVTTPNSVTMGNVNLADVATLLAMSDPFPVHDETDVGVCTIIKNTITDIILPLFKTKEGGKDEITMLHLIQLTGTDITPGNFDFAQPFPPLMVEFPDAAIRKNKEEKWQLFYTLGCQATAVYEAVVLATALLQALEQNARAPDKTEETVDDTHIPDTHMVPTTLPLKATDSEYKKYALKSTETREGFYGITNSFRDDSSTKGRLDMNTYYELYNLDKSQSVNKAARVVLGDISSLAEENRAEKQAYKTPPGHYTGVVHDEPLGPGGRDVRVKKCNTIIVRDTVPGTLNRDKSFLESLLKAEVYDDFLFKDMVSTLPEVGERRPRDFGNYELEPKDNTKGIAFPVYKIQEQELEDYDDTYNADIVLVGFITLRNVYITKNLEHEHDNDTVLYGIKLSFDEHVPVVTSYRSIGLDLALDKNRLSFQTDQNVRYFIGLYLSHNFSTQLHTQRYRLLMKKKIEADITKTVATLMTEARESPYPRFLPLYDLTDMAFLTINEKNWDLNHKAYTSDMPTPKTLKYDRTVFTVKPEEISNQLTQGFQGFHFSRADAARRTTFAVAVNETLATIKDWYNSPVGGSTEPRAINLVNPENKNEAMLVQMIRDGESDAKSVSYTSASSRGRSSVMNREALVVPLVVIVRGPGNGIDTGTLATPCIVENVWVQTSAYRIVESEVIHKLYTTLTQHSRTLPSGHSRNCLAVHLWKRETQQQTRLQYVRQLLQYGSKYVTPIGNLMVLQRTYDQIPKRSDVPRSSPAVTGILDSIEVAIKQLLYIV